MNESETDQIVSPKYFNIDNSVNGGRGTHFAKFLISPFQWGLTHSALVRGPTDCQLHRASCSKLVDWGVPHWSLNVKALKGLMRESFLSETKLAI